MGNKKEIQLRLLVILGIAAVFMLCIRAWFFLLICLIVQAVILLVLAIGRKRENPATGNKSEEVVHVTIAEPVKSLPLQITEQVNELYPGAKWVWAEPDSATKILNDGHAYILLNRAGGYGKACVICCDGKVEHIEMIGKVPAAGQDAPSVKESPTLSAPKEQPAVNYELLAYEWVESHILELNARCNEELGDGKVEFIVPESDLPAKESWAEVCKELVRNGLDDVECVEEGIKITLSNEKRSFQ